MVIVYVDILFIINFSVDYIVLLLTSMIFHFQMRKWRGVVTAFLLAVYGIWALLICGSYILLIVTAFLSVAVACRFSYPIRGLKMLLKCMFVFMLLSFMIGGLVEVLFRITGHLTQQIGGERDGKQVIVFAGLALLSGIMIHIGNRLLDKGCRVRYIDIKFSIFNKDFKATLLVDSGNLVYEPLSGRHVLFVTEKYAKRSGFLHYINNNENILKRKRVLCIDTANGKRAIDAYLCDQVKLSDKMVSGAVAIMYGGENEIYDGVFPSALL